MCHGRGGGKPPLQSSPTFPICSPPKETPESSPFSFSAAISVMSLSLSSCGSPPPPPQRAAGGGDPSHHLKLPGLHRKRKTKGKDRDKEKEKEKEREAKARPPGGGPGLVGLTEHQG